MNSTNEDTYKHEQTHQTDSEMGIATVASNQKPDNSLHLALHCIDGTPQDVVDRYESLPHISEKTDFGWLENNVVVIDTEATGLSYKKDELIQIAAARMEQGKIVDWFITFVNPGQTIPEEIIHLTGITNEDVKDAPTPEEALSQLVEFAGNALMVAHNASFDKTFVTKHPAGYPLLENIWIDSLDLSRIALPRLRGHRLIDLATAFNAPASTHRADDDVATTCIVYRILLAAVAAMPISLVATIAGFGTPETWPTRIVFASIAAGAPYVDPRSIVIRSTNRDSVVEESIDQKSTTPRSITQNPTTQNLTIKNPTNQEPANQEPVNQESTNRETTAQIGVQTQHKHAFSLAAMRQTRVASLPVRLARKDADKIAAGTLSASGAPDSTSTAASSSTSASSSTAVQNASSATATSSGTPASNTSGATAAQNASSDTPEHLIFPSKATLDEAFSSEGLMGAIYPDYEPRQEQRAMAQAIRQAFEASENITVEAGTGVGKSMAYLVPAVLTAVENGIGVGVATNTNALLDQLVYKELPDLAAALEELYPNAEQLEWATLKGITHYPCLRRVQHLVDDGPGVRMVANEEVSQAPALAALLSFIEQTEFDDIDGLKLDYRALPRYLFTTTSTECLRRKCPFYNQLCLVHAARKRAEKADIVVTNHTMLFCDIAADGGLLPPLRYWVVDEAHNAEDEARRSFTQTVAVEDIMRIMQRVSDEGGKKNVFSRAERSIAGADGEQVTLFLGLISKARAAGNAYAEHANQLVVHIKDLLFFDTAGKKSGYESFDLWINNDVRKSQVFGDIAIVQQAFVEAADKLIKAMQDLVAYLEGIDEATAAQREIASVAVELKTIRNAAELIFQTAPDSYVYQATLNRKKDKHTDKIEALLLDVGEKLNETLYARTHSVAFASATLAINGSFKAFEDAVGLNQGEFSQASSLLLDSSYDFDNNMIVYVVKDMPEPTDTHYQEKLVELLIKVHKAQMGSTLTLFTNRREMEQCHAQVQPALKEDDLRVVCQKWGVSVKGLRDDFVADEHLSLFALKSFWQGFDAPGATLKTVVIPKLPFARPTDPLYCERANRDDAAWWHYVLPQAVIETKQAAGRLIRKATDRGSLILADKRLLTKSYSKAFLGSLQSKTIKICTMDEIARSLEVLRDW